MALKQYEYSAVLAPFSREMLPGVLPTTRRASNEALPYSPVFFSPVSYALPSAAYAAVFKVHGFVYLDTRKRLWR
jgi:hypothetical protein